jgi:hypothetical protein
LPNKYKRSNEMVLKGNNLKSLLHIMKQSEMKRNHLKVLQLLQVRTITGYSIDIFTVRFRIRKVDDVAMCNLFACSVHTTYVLDNVPIIWCSVEKRSHILQRAVEQGTDTVNEV